MDEIETTNDGVVGDNETAGDDAEELVAEKSHGSDSAFGDGSVR